MRAVTAGPTSFGRTYVVSTSHKATKMPRGSNLPATQDAGSNDLASLLPADIVADLLRSQAEEITTTQPLPRVKVMGGGVGRYEFSDTNEDTNEFRGVILNTHPRNILWDKPYGEQSEGGEGANRPACSSNDGKKGQPRPGFAHAALGGVAASGTELIDCGTCPYNQFGSKGLISGDPSAKGKAVTNNRSVYVLLEDRQMPVEVVLPPTSLKAYDDYSANLINRGLPVQAVVTVFRQEKKQKGTLKWAQATFAVGETLDADAFAAVMEKRNMFMRAITPRAPQTDAGVEEAEYEDVTDQQGGGDEGLPF